MEEEEENVETQWGKVETNGVFIDGPRGLLPANSSGIGCMRDSFCVLIAAALLEATNRQVRRTSTHPASSNSSM